MNKKIIIIFICMLLITTIFPVIGISNTSDIKIRNLNKNEIKTGEVQKFSTRNIQILDNGSAEINLIINLPESPLSEIYCDFFGIEDPVIGEEYEIPETRSVTPIIEFGEGVEDHSLLGDVNADGIVNFKDLIFIIKAIFNMGVSPRWIADLDSNGEIDFQDFIVGIKNYGKKREPLEPVIQPVREPLLQGIVDEICIPLGFPEIIPLGFGEIIPLGEDDATHIMVEFNSPQLAYYDYEQECLIIQVGPWYETAFEDCWEFLMAKILYLQLMLESFQSEDASFYSSSITTFVLPQDSTIINTQDLIEKSWYIDFTNGTYVTAWLTLSDNQVILTEEMHVSENVITIPEILGTFSYQRFDIQYTFFSHNVSPFSNSVLKNEKEFRPELNYMKKAWDWGFNSIGSYLSVKWEEGSTIPPPYQGYLLVKADVSGKFHAEWDWDLNIKLVPYFPFIIANPELYSYESYVDLDFEFNVRGDILTTEAYKKIWTQQLYNMGLSIIFVVGDVPVEVTVDFSITGAIDFTVQSKSYYYVNTWVWADGLRGGVKWNNKIGWDQIYNLPTIKCGHLGPDIDITGDAYICPSAEFKLAGWVYHTAGPFITFIPAVPIDITYPPLDWTVRQMIEIKGGAEFAGWLYRLFSWLPRYETTLYHEELNRWTS